MRYWFLAGLTVVCGGCAFAADVVGALEPLLDVAVDSAAASAAQAAEDAAKRNGLNGLEVGAITAGSVASLWGVAKTALFAWNRKPTA